eukprot:348839-Hanusia_phi.AAC.1
MPGPVLVNRDRIGRTRKALSCQAAASDHSNASLRAFGSVTVSTEYIYKSKLRWHIGRVTVRWWHIGRARGDGTVRSRLSPGPGPGGTVTPAERRTARPLSAYSSIESLGPSGRGPGRAFPGRRAPTRGRRGLGSRGPPR